MAIASVEREMAARGEGCLGKAHPDEPVFILRAQDKLSADLVELWASWAAENGCSDEKVEEALALAAQMRRWPTRKYPD